MRMTRTPGYRTARPATAAPGRWHGSLDTVTDSERRGLRPIGMTAREVAVRTGVLLRAVPGVLVFQGVRPAAGELPRIPHAISAGRRLILVESVAWPPGRYRQGADGRIHCDGMYTGQSVQPLVSAVRYWQATLPRGHRVSALVVVHPSGEGALVLPDAVTGEAAWTRACDTVRAVRTRLPRGRPAASARAVAALVAATAPEDVAGQAPEEGT
jgi:hypothetical protein